MGNTIHRDMRVLVVAFVAVMALQLAAGRGIRARRGFNSSGFGTGGYGRGSDERDASVSQENQGCSGNNSRGYGSNNSGSRELPFRDGRDSGSTERVRGGRSFSRASASASASASAYKGHLKGNLVDTVKPQP